MKQARDPFGIPAIGLDRHGLQRPLHLPGFHQHDVKSSLGQPAVQPLRQGTGFQANGGEPGTVLWFALQADDTLAIFDIFADEDARDAHFSGAVAAALNQNADTLVNGGREDGVVANINNSDVLSVKVPVDLDTATTATYIKLEAASGKGPELAALLTAAGPIVADTEPKTLFWAALQIDESNFAIFDIFADNSGREAHFAGQVAGLLNAKASELVSGGWDDGVVANVRNFDILAAK